MKKGDPGADTTRSVLERLARGEIELEDALQDLRLLQVDHVQGIARLDVNRDRRKGVPEIVFAPGKSDEALGVIVRRLLDGRGLALVSRLDSTRAEALKSTLVEGPASVSGVEFDHRAEAGALACRTAAYQAPEARGMVGVLTAGTSDIAVAEEAAFVSEYMGCRVERGYDVGVAGIHRLFEPLDRVLRAGAEVIIVVAGMEGALPSVVAGLVDVPVIGVPTSTGYGLGGAGKAALYSILQSCSPGLVAVNIDNGVGAGAAAGLIARGC